MKRAIRLVVISAMLASAITPASAFLTDNSILNNILVNPRVDSWPAQPTYPGQPTYPTPPEYPGNPNYPGNPGYPGNGNYESSDQLYNTGRQAFDRGDYYTATQTFKRFLDRYPYEYRAPEVCFLTAQSYHRTSDFGNALVFYRRVSAQYSTNVNAEPATYNIGYCLVKLNDFYSAINEFRNFVSRYPYSQLADDAWYVTGLTYEKLNDNYNAILAYQKVVYDFPGSNYYTDARQRLQILQGNVTNPGYPTTPTNPTYPTNPTNPGNQTLSDYEMYNRGHSLFVSGNYASAISYFEELLRRYPSSQYADDASFWTAKVRWQQKSYQLAINAFENFLRSYPGSEFEPEAVYNLAQAEKENGRINAANRNYLKLAASHFAWFQQNWPLSNYAAEALFQAGDCYEIYGDYSSARNCFQQIINIYPHSAAATKAREKLSGRW